MNRVYILIAILVGILILTILLVRTSSKSAQQAAPSVVTFSPSPSSKPISTAQPQIVNTGYSTEGLSKNSQRIAAHSTLSTEDQTVFNKMTTSLDGNANILVTTDNFQVKYVNPPNEFLVAITVNNADQAKKDFISWLKQQGFSDQGVCRLPYVIYLNPDVKNYYQQNNLQFNPMPEGC